MMIMISESKYYALELHNDEGYILLTRKLFVQEQEYRQPLLDVLDLIEKHRVTKFISDTSALGAFSVADQNWTALEWVPMAEKKGLKYFAIVEPLKNIGKIATKSMEKNALKKGQIGFQHQFFSSIDESIKWITENKS